MIRWNREHCKRLQQAFDYVADVNIENVFASATWESKATHPAITHLYTMAKILRDLGQFYTMVTHF